MELPLFPSRPTCTACALHEGVRSPGIPARHVPHSLAPDPTRPAVLLVGQNPGLREDEQGMCFVGPTGKMATEVYIGHHHPVRGSVGSRLDLRAACYFANAARCATWGDLEPSPSQYRLCTPFLLEDIALILPTCSRLLLLLMGAPAISSVYTLLTGASLSVKDATNRNGTLLPLPAPLAPATVQVYATYHPAFVLRKNTMITAVIDHLSLLVDSLDGISPIPSSPLRIPPRSPLP